MYAPRGASLGFGLRCSGWHYGPPRLERHRAATRPADRRQCCLFEIPSRDTRLPTARTAPLPPPAPRPSSDLNPPTCVLPTPRPAAGTRLLPARPPAHCDNCFLRFRNFKSAPVHSPNLISARLAPPPGSVICRPVRSSRDARADWRGHIKSRAAARYRGRDKIIIDGRGGFGLWVGSCLAVGRTLIRFACMRLSVRVVFT